MAKAKRARTVLTPAKARKIRELAKSGNYSQRAIGAKFGVARSTVYAVIHGESWKDA